MSFEQNPADQADISGADFAIMRDEMQRLKQSNELLVSQLATIQNERGLCWTLDEKAAGLLRDFIGEGDETMEIELSVGASRDDDGNIEYGLRVVSSEYPEEGCLPLATCKKTDFQKAFFDVVGERLRQQSVEGFSLVGDDRYEDQSLESAAACYAMSAAELVGSGGGAPGIWPWDIKWWKPTTPRRDLVKAGALILAAIERRDRAETKKGGE